MKKTLFLVAFIFNISCVNKTESNADKTSEKKTDAINNLENKKEVSKITFKEHLTDGLLLIGQIKLFDESLNQIGTLDIEENTKVQILEKSVGIFNIEKSSDYCLKSNFLRIKHKDNIFLVFGNEVYEINEIEKIDFQNDNNEKFSIFSITNFEMGAGDEEGLTGCDDFSYLIVLDIKNKKYLTIAAPKNQENHSNERYASLLHDDGQENRIYSVKAIKDSLIVGIKVSYQEGYGSFYLKSSFRDQLAHAMITNQNRFDEENKYNELH